MTKEIRIPEISENVTSGTVIEVFVKPGDEVKVDDPLIEFETDKAVVEIPSPFKGQITEVLAKEGQEMKVGEVIAKIDAANGKEQEDSGREQAQAEDSDQTETEKESGPEEPDATARDERDDKAAAVEQQEAADTGSAKDTAAVEETPARSNAKQRLQTDDDNEQSGPVPASPSVRRLARELGVDIHAVKTAGPGDRISEADVKAHVKKERMAERPGGSSGPVSEQAEQPTLPDFSRWGQVEVQPLSAVRRLTTASVTASWQTVVHVTQFERVDISAVEAFLRRKAEEVADQEAKLTITAVLIKICAAALTRFPSFNASIDPARNQLILKKYVHIGLAVDTPRGLLVPVVRHADRKTILELAVEIVDLARRARNKKIKPDEMEGGSFTISNQGGIGGTDFTPVVLWPQAAILGVSRTRIKPGYVGGEIRPRKMLPLALSYDHRIVDGADAARFVGWIRESLEQPLTMHFD